MEFKVLGPLEVYDTSGAEIRLPGGRERALLVALLLRRGEVVSVDALIDALWGERAPSTAPKAVQGYVSHLRRALGAAGDALVTQPPGYVLRITDDEVDAAQFERLAADGRRALEDGDPAEALGALESALAIWRGPALAEFAFEDFAQPEIQRLTERRLDVQEDRANALLGLGRHTGLVAELESLVQAHPERERLRGLLMLALYRAGRQADALRVYRDGRRLANELGLDPSPELRQLERAILEHDPAIAAPLPPTADQTGPEQQREMPPPEEAAGEPVPAEHPPRRPWIALAVAAALAAVVVVTGLVVLSRGESRSVEVVPPAVAVVDPATNRVTASVRVGSRPVSIAAGDGAVWVGDARDGTVTRIDPETLDAKSIGVGAPAIDLAVHDGSVWVATGGFGTVVRVDTELESVADEISLSEPDDPVVPAVSSIAAGSEGLWVGSFDGLVRLDPRSGGELVRVDLGRTPALQIALGDGAVWATTIASRVKRVEARSAEETVEFYAGSTVYPIAVADDGVWVGAAASISERGQLWKLHPVTAAQELSTRLPGWATGVAVGAGVVWVAVPSLDAILRIDPETGEVEATVPVGGSPEDLVVADGRVWVTVLAPEKSG